MPTHFYAFTEIKTAGGWRLADLLVVDEDAERVRLIPHNMAGYWDWGSIEAIAVESGERGLPPDMSPGLRRYLEREWAGGAEAYWASWMTLEEIRWREAADPMWETRHFQLEKISTHGRQDNQVRVVFWHD